MCAPNRPFSRPELCHNQTDPLPKREITWQRVVRCVLSDVGIARDLGLARPYPTRTKKVACKILSDGRSRWPVREGWLTVCARIVLTQLISPRCFSTGCLFVRRAV